MKEEKKIITISNIIGILVRDDASALEAIEILEEAKENYLDRCYHITSNKKAD